MSTSNETQQQNPAFVVPPNYQYKSRKKYAKLAWWLGEFGAHNFYAGYKLRGWLGVLFCWTGLPWIIGQIEVHCVKKDANGVPFIDDGDY